jgi:hypothetical protein
MLFSVFLLTGCGGSPSASPSAFVSAALRSPRVAALARLMPHHVGSRRCTFSNLPPATVPPRPSLVARCSAQLARSASGGATVTFREDWRIGGQRWEHAWTFRIGRDRRVLQVSDDGANPPQSWK